MSERESERRSDLAGVYTSTLIHMFIRTPKIVVFQFRREVHA